MKLKNRKTDFVPYVPASRSLPELTLFAVILGMILAIVFGAANAYLGLKTGLTVTASIPAAVVSMAILRGILQRESILENNIVQTMTTAGEAVAAGAIFTLPALFMWNVPPSKLVIAFLVLTGGFLGVLMMVPLRRLLIVNEHETLPYPEGTACAEVLKSGETGGRSAKLILYGFLLGGLFKALGDGWKLFKTSIEAKIWHYKNAVLSLDAMPALLGVGFIIGPRIAGQMIAGGLLASIVFIPLISFFTSGSPHVIFPASHPIGHLSAAEIYDSYIRYIGAGAVTAGGLITLVKTLPLLWGSLRDTFHGLRQRKNGSTTKLKRTDRDIPALWLGVGILVLIFIIAFTPVTNVGIVGAIAIAVFGFLFVTVAARIVGITGSTSMPVSGMTIATLLIVTLIFDRLGMTGMTGMVMSLTVAAIVCLALAVAGDISQDLKTGFLVGGTPWKQQIAMMIGVVASGLSMGFILVLYHQAYTLGSKILPAPKAALMKVIPEGIMSSHMPWELLIFGIALAIAIEFLGLNSLTVAVGFYLPLSVSAPIMVGGAIYWLTMRGKKKEERKRRNESGTLFASGLIAGEALISVVIAIFIVAGLVDPAAPAKWENPLVSLGLFLLLAVVMWWVAVRRSKA